MNMKKIAILALSLCMVAAIAVTGTIAYFTDTDKATNTFVMGNVSIDLIEQRRGADGELENYPDDSNTPAPQPLYPIVGSAQGEKDELDLPVAENYVDKVITIKNDGTEDAFVRLYFAIPAVLDDGYDTYNANMNVLHFNYGVNPDTKATTWQNEWKWYEEKSGKYQSFLMDLDGEKYNVYYAEYYQPLTAEQTTLRAVNGVYLDSTFNFDDDGNAYYVKDGVQKMIMDTENSNLTLADIAEVKIPVFAIACQTAGFDADKDGVFSDDEIDAAFDETFGEKYVPFAGAALVEWYY